MTVTPLPSPPNGPPALPQNNAQLFIIVIQHIGKLAKMIIPAGTFAVALLVGGQALVYYRLGFDLTDLPPVAASMELAGAAALLTTLPLVIGIFLTYALLGLRPDLPGHVDLYSTCGGTGRFVRAAIATAIWLGAGMLALSTYTSVRLFRLRHLADVKGSIVISLGTPALALFGIALFTWGIRQAHKPKAVARVRREWRKLYDTAETNPWLPTLATFFAALTAAGIIAISLSTIVAIDIANGISPAVPGLVFGISPECALVSAKDEPPVATGDNMVLSSKGGDIKLVIPRGRGVSFFAQTYSVTQVDPSECTKPPAVKH